VFSGVNATGLSSALYCLRSPICLALALLCKVAWLLNCRGGDVPYNPVFVAYALVTPTTAAVYTDAGRIPNDVAEHLKVCCVDCWCC